MNLFFNNRKTNYNNVINHNNITYVPKTLNQTISKSRVWGPTTWMLFHTLAEKIKEEHFNTYKSIILKFIIDICRNLPCPTCRNDATKFLRKCKLNLIQDKNQLKLFLHRFHNRINEKTFKPIKETSILSKYENLDVIKVVNLWSYYFNTFNSEAHEFVEQLERNNIKMNLKNFIINNRNAFN